MIRRDRRRSLAVAALMCAMGEGLFSLDAVADRLPGNGFNAVTSTVPAADDAANNVAAVVDGHKIPMRDVELLCLRNQRSYVVDQMIQNFVVDRECKRRGITFSDAEIDNQVADLRKQYAPATLEDSLKDHGWTMAELRQQLRFKLGRQRLVDDAIKPIKMAHCREILVKCGGYSGAGRTEAQALAVIKDVQEKLRLGEDFGDLAARYSEAETRLQNGDIGVLYDNMLGSVDAAVLAEGMALGRGEVSKMSIRTADGYCLVQAISANDSHIAAEDALYKDAAAECRKTQAMFLEPKIVGDLIRSSTVTYVDDADLVPGKPLPVAAATIDGHPLSMQDVLVKCLAQGGRQTTDILVQNYVVDRECARRGITVGDAEIDRSVAELRRRIAPHTIEEGLPVHHTTMAGLRQQFKQQIERTKLVTEQVKPAKMVHCRVILVRAARSQNAPFASGIAFPAAVMNAAAANSRTTAQTQSIVAHIEAQLKNGGDFEKLAGQYSETEPKGSGGDLGILYPGIRDVDTTILQAALTMKMGQTTPQAVKTLDGYAFIQAVSTGDDHTPGENPLYAEALETYREQQAQPLIPQAIMELVKSAKVVNYVH